jgi:hypothetical protein
MASCYCFDLCCDNNNVDLNHKGIEFIGRTRYAVLDDSLPLSPSLRWFHYFNAVYDGSAAQPFDMARVNIFYQNTNAWRQKHPDTANPFRDCLDSRQRMCSRQECSAWEEGLFESPVHLPKLGCYQWPQGHWLSSLEHGGTEADHEQRLIQIVSWPDEEHPFGRPIAPDHGWIEIIRSDARPYFEEGLRPPDCPDWSVGGTYESHSRCWSRLHAYAGGRFPPGCWARQVVGSGVWVSTNRSIRARSLDDWQSVFDTQEYSFDEWPNMLDFVLYASNQSIDTIQFKYGEEYYGMHPPLFVVTSPECVGRDRPLKACLSREMMRGGMADRTCDCDDTLEPHRVLDLGAVEAQGEQQPPKASDPFELAGAINCKTNGRIIGGPPPRRPPTQPLPMHPPPSPTPSEPPSPPAPPFSPLPPAHPGPAQPPLPHAPPSGVSLPFGGGVAIAAFATMVASFLLVRLRRRAAQTTAAPMAPVPAKKKRMKGPKPKLLRTTEDEAHKAESLGEWANSTLVTTTIGAAPSGATTIVV